MKTLGERIRQAREAKGWSGEYLAKKVGYKTQSGISNLEARATGSGGNKIGAIADALDVSLDWLMRGPDMEEVPFTSNMVDRLDSMLENALVQQDDVYRLPQKQNDPQTSTLLALWSQLDAAGKSDAITLLRGFLAGRRPTQTAVLLKWPGRKREPREANKINNHAQIQLDFVGDGPL